MERLSQGIVGTSLTDTYEKKVRGNRGDDIAVIFVMFMVDVVSGVVKLQQGSGAMTAPRPGILVAVLRILGISLNRFRRASLVVRHLTRQLGVEVF